MMGQKQSSNSDGMGEERDASLDDACVQETERGRYVIAPLRSVLLGQLREFKKGKAKASGTSCLEFVGAGFLD